MTRGVRARCTEWSPLCASPLVAVSRLYLSSAAATPRCLTGVLFCFSFCFLSLSCAHVCRCGWRVACVHGAQSGRCVLRRSSPALVVSCSRFLCFLSCVVFLSQLWPCFSCLCVRVVVRWCFCVDVVFSLHALAVRIPLTSTCFSNSRRVAGVELMLGHVIVEYMQHTYSLTINHVSGSV